MDNAVEKKYRVGVTRTGYRAAVIHVVAASEDEARRKVIDAAGDHLFPNEYASDYEVTAVEVAA